MTSGADVWRSPGGEHFRLSWSEEAGPSRVRLKPAVYDADTGQWSTDSNALPVEVDAAVFEETYVRVRPERLRDPRITRLTGLVAELLADYERSTGRPPADADVILAALDDVAEIPEEARRRRHAAARSAASQGFHRGRRR
ncbi:hypothetical protein C0Q58_30700 [Streptomyces albidoflavus]|uniref:hypothetical protein n=1 Tax=Streptomyces albidoflavus TaxID=1886 RepID=UPI00101E8396|nr:hypothetical protein [Streptomyces albidoflavus]RZD54907.1 hypothetical protein C0Q58_30700 [Streptomyces albidoflavus]